MISRLRQAREHVLVQALVTQLAVEAFDARVLLRLARLDVVPADPIGRPPEHRDAGQFGSILADDHLWDGSLECEPF